MRIAVKDTFGYVKVGDNETRHQIVAGQEIPDIYRVDDESAYRDADHSPIEGIGSPSYRESQKTLRVDYEEDRADRSVNVVHEPEEVTRTEGYGPDNPLAEHEPALAASQSPLGDTPVPEGETAKARGRRADKETADTRASEEGASPAERIEARLKGEGGGRSSRGRSRTRGQADEPKADEKDDESGESSAAESK